MDERKTWVAYLAVCCLLGVVGGLLIGLGRPQRPLVALAAVVPFAAAVIWPPPLPLALRRRFLRHWE
jgi:hypothetical protein